MSEAKDVEDLKNSPEGEAISHDSGDDPKESDKDQNDESLMPSPQQEVTAFSDSPFSMYFVRIGIAFEQEKLHLEE